jgi:drug/metabolite transporter (DMT)-like permease
MIDIFLVFASLASAITVNKLLLVNLPPIFFVGIRMLLAGLILFIVLRIKKQRIPWGLVRTDALILSGIIIWASAPPLLKAYALKYLPSAKAAYFGALDPFITSIYAYFLFSEKITLRQIIGIAIGVGGACVILMPGGSFEPWHAFSFFSYPELAALGAVALGRLGWLLAQKILRQGKYSPLQLNAMTMLCCGVLSLGISGIVDRGFFSTIVHDPSQLPLLGWWYVFLLGYTVIVGNVVSITYYATLLKKYPATLLSLAGFSVPLFVAIYGYFFLHEPLSTSFFISCLLTFTGLIIFSSGKKEQLS